MAVRDLTGFFLDVERLFGSTAVRRMSLAEFGVYVLMLCQQWREESRNLPDDPQAVADLITVTPAQAAEVFAAWEVVRRKFVTSDHTPGRIWNIALERTRTQQRKFRRKRSDAGRVGGKASAAKRAAARDLDSNDRSTIVQRPSSAEAVAESCVGTGTPKKNGSAATPAASTSPPVLVFPTLGPVKEWVLTRAQVDEFRAAYERIDVEAECRKALVWVRANQRKTARGMRAFLVRWLNRCADRGGASPLPPAAIVRDYGWLDDCQHEPKCGSLSIHTTRCAVDAGRAAKAVAS